MKEYFLNIWLGVYTVLVGMKITLIHGFSKKVTNQYPDNFPDAKSLIDSRLMAPNARNRLFVDMEECNGCNWCVRACPVNCITVDSIKAVPTDNVPPLKSGGKRGLWVSNFQIDFAKCCFCSLCTLDCPTGAIRMTSEFEYSTYERNSLIYTFSTMTPEQIAEKQEKLSQFQIEKKKADAAKKAADAKAAADNKAE
jgi:NADH-quinone oxidoreductase subunit I